MMTNKILISLLIFVSSFQSYSCSKKDSNPVKEQETTGIIDADNPNIQYVGRFDRSNPKKAIFDWPGVYIRAKFEGTSCSIRLIDGNNYYDITIDNQSPQVLKTNADTVYHAAVSL